MGDQRRALYFTPQEPGARVSQAAPGRSSCASHLFLGPALPLRLVWPPLEGKPQA